MQDVHHIDGGGGGGGGGGGRFLGGGDRRLRPHTHHQALKCPRCESLNTKFCYYNNYNLSQPRHFCKSCRRYWTKGGVLRNVPVGGGCRKAKRSKQKSSASSSGDGDGDGERISGVQSPSSESSSLTAATTATTPTSTAAAEDGSAPSTAAGVYSFSDGRFFGRNPSFDNQPIVNQATDGQIFPTESFTSLMTSSTDMIGFGIPDIQTTSYQRAAQQGNRIPASEILAPVSVDQAAEEEEFKMQELSDEGLAAVLDWGSGGGGGGGGDQGLFDLTAGVDPAYWTQPQWTDSDNPSVNFLP